MKNKKTAGVVYYIHRTLLIELVLVSVMALNATFNNNSFVDKQQMTPTLTL